MTVITFRIENELLFNNVYIWHIFFYKTFQFRINSIIRNPLESNLNKKKITAFILKNEINIPDSIYESMVINDTE